MSVYFKVDFKVARVTPRAPRAQAPQLRCVIAIVSEGRRETARLDSLCSLLLLAQSGSSVKGTEDPAQVTLIRKGGDNKDT